jgi:hypothetical protein
MLAETKELQDSIESFVSECEKLDRGQSAKLHITNKELSVYRNGETDIEYGNLFDIATFIDGEAVDDETAIYIDDLTKAIEDIVFERKKFSTL